YPFALFVAVVGSIVAWEWGRIVRGGGIDLASVTHILIVLLAAALAAFGMAALAVLAVLIGMLLVALLTSGRHAGLSSFGVLYAGLPVTAMVWLRDGPFGATAIVFLVVTVAATDIGAYFAGRLIGGPKLAPAISPNKTWAGLIGALLASALVGVATGLIIPATSSLVLGAFAMGLALVAQAGDLGESAIKRKFGAKDASNIIPGHGGFMDRVDGLIPVLVIAGLIGAWLNIREPARALLQW
ncbi:MAG: phosphatidate cytidylyltransferase, partial [Anaerolineae bacterium]|nr:phosphatidate cytidylyltransferase [Anaerolineae bacterium]